MTNRGRYYSYDLKWASRLQFKKSFDRITSYCKCGPYYMMQTGLRKLTSHVDGSTSREKRGDTAEQKVGSGSVKEFIYIPSANNPRLYQMSN